MDDPNDALKPVKEALKDEKRIRYHNGYLTNLLAAIKWVLPLLLFLQCQWRFYLSCQFVSDMQSGCVCTTGKMVAMWKAISFGLYWIIGSGQLVSLQGLAFTLLITGISWRDTPRTRFNGSRISWLLRNLRIWKKANTTVWCFCFCCHWLHRCRSCDCVPFFCW